MESLNPTPSYVLVETELPNTATKEYLAIRNYNPKLLRPPKPKDAPKNDEDEDDSLSPFADQKIVRCKRGNSKLVDLQTV